MTRILGAIVFRLKTYKKQISFLFLKLILILLVPSISFSAKQFKEPQFKEPRRDKLIISSVIDQFQKECVHTYTVDKSTLNKIQEYYTEYKERFSKEQKECFDSYLLKLQGIYVVYQQTCDEINSTKVFDSDADSARVFINIRQYLTSFKVTHKLLNNCLARGGISEENLIELSDYETGTKQVFKKLREMDIPQPFREESVHFR